MPVPCNRLKAKVVFGSKMSFQTARPDDQQHGRTKRYMQAVETGQHKKCGAVGQGADSEDILPPRPGARQTPSGQIPGQSRYLDHKWKTIRKIVRNSPG